MKCMHWQSMALILLEELIHWSIMQVSCPYHCLKGRTDEWDHMIDVNIKGVLYGIDSVYFMFERESGQIINISSVAGKRVMPMQFILEPNMPSELSLRV